MPFPKETESIRLQPRVAVSIWKGEPYIARSSRF